jgi:hypothetical protein
MLHMNHFKHKTMKPMAIFNSCSRIPSLQLTHCLISITSVVISSILSFDEHLSQTITPCVPTSRCSVSVRYALPKDSRIATDDVDVKQCSRINTCSAREYIVVAPAQLLRNRGGSGLSVTGQVDRENYKDRTKGRACRGANL